MTQRYDWMSHQLIDLKKHMIIVLDASLPNKQQNKAAKDMVEVYFNQAEQSMSTAWGNQLRLLRETECTQSI